MSWFADGKVSVNADPGFDYEYVTEFYITVKATDGGGASSTATLTVQIEDVNEKPRFDNSDVQYYTIKERTVS